jgi:hypothetical protein
VKFLAQGRHLDRPRLQQLIHILVHDFVARHILLGDLVGATVARSFKWIKEYL